MIKSLFSVVLRAADVPKLSKFYKETLGLKVVEESKKFALLDLGSAKLVIQPLPEAELERKDKGLPRTSFGMQVDDVDAVYKKLKGSVKFREEPTDEDWGGRCASATDPEGNNIDFIQTKK